MERNLGLPGGRGGPSRVDLFNPKPELTKYHGTQYDKEIEKHFRNRKETTLMASPFEFRPYGESGMEFSEVVPHLGSVADELTLVRSMYNDRNNHGEGWIMIQTGKIFPRQAGDGFLDQLCPEF